ncbi:MAG: type IV conjugative transfer system coupling protein TraD [Alphaproteobacteria bacterium]|nr:type IV conjugative transfer system coupling protein TraD [Alphaproteobacteria bacterium]MBP9776246.1 type IV conjugative transfer system coupling protein TraD [Alphaproteobacteria bacterium]
MAFFKTMTQGGQVHIHQLRMLKQIFIVGLIVALVLGTGNFMWKSYELPIYGWQTLRETYWAQFMLATVPEEKHKALSQAYTPPKGKSYQRSCLSILKDPHLKETTQTMEKALEEIAIQSLKFAGGAFFIIMGFWFFFGLAQKRNQHQRGNTLESPKRLARIIKRRREASDLELGYFPLLKDKETSHTLITGTTGSGKTNTFHMILPQLRHRGDPALIMDITGNYVSRYYNKKTDIILNPLDIRSPHWHPWVDCHLDSHYDVLAESFVQSKDNSKDPFWDNASRAVLKTALRKFNFQGEKDVQKLYSFLLSSSDKEFEDFFKNTEAATFAYRNNEKTTHSIRSVLSSQIECLRQLDFPSLSPKERGENPSTKEDPDNSQIPAFSIRNWVMNERQKGWLFITARPDQRETLRPLISAWMDIAINALMVLPENQKRRLWFVIDELAALQKLPRLQAGLAEGRKYGGCFLVGFQSKPQLEDIYGRNAAEAMLDLFNTKLFFRCTEPSTQQWISKVLGDKEETEPQENISYGANSMRDGVSLSHHTRQKPLVMPAELSQLKNLECYLKLPGDYPSTKLQTQFQQAPKSQKNAFLLKPDKERDYTLPVNKTSKKKEENII